MPSSQSRCNSAEDCPSSIAAIISSYITAGEEEEIRLQFESHTWRPDSLVLWSGIPRDEAEAWAAKRGRQTLALAMGPLMNRIDPGRSDPTRTAKTWPAYMKGASAVFAWYTTLGGVVTILTPPPPVRYNPSERSTFQRVEEPIIAECIKNSKTRICVMMVHPTVKEAEDFSYQISPVDETQTWIARFGTCITRVLTWRGVKKAAETSRAVGTGKTVSVGKAVLSTSEGSGSRLKIMIKKEERQKTRMEKAKETGEGKKREAARHMEEAKQKKELKEVTEIKKRLVAKKMEEEAKRGKRVNKANKRKAAKEMEEEAKQRREVKKLKKMIAAKKVEEEVKKRKEVKKAIERKAAKEAKEAKKKKEGKEERNGEAAKKKTDAKQRKKRRKMEEAKRQPKITATDAGNNMSK